VIDFWKPEALMKFLETSVRVDLEKYLSLPTFDSFCKKWYLAGADILNDRGLEFRAGIEKYKCGEQAQRGNGGAYHNHLFQTETSKIALDHWQSR
jgi:hypothetical protein